MRPQRLRRGDRGVALVVVLVAMTVLVFMAFAALRGSMSADDVANALVAQSQARESAQLALRYCERELLEENPAVPSWPAPAASAPPAWRTLAHWAGPTSIASRVPAAIWSPPEGATPSPAPQCIAERSPLGAAGVEVVVVTARGFSADFAETPDGRSLSGAVVWLQSTVSLGAP